MRDVFQKEFSQPQNPLNLAHGKNMRWEAKVFKVGFSKGLVNPVFNSLDT